MIFNLLTPQGFMSLSDYGGNETADTTGGKNTPSRISLGKVVITANAQNVLADRDINIALLSPSIRRLG